VPVVDVPVLVVGAGPVGLTAALLLAGRGVEVLVVERHREPYGLPRAVHLDDEVLRVLQEVGVADDVVRDALVMAGLRLVDARSRTLAEFPRDPARRPHGWPPGVLFSQPRLEVALRAAVAREPRITLQSGVELVGLTQDDDAVDALLRPRDSGPDRSVRARFALGCDGAGSTVRQLLGIGMRDLGRADRWLVVDARARSAVPVWPGVHQVVDRHRAATFMPLPDGHYRWEFRLGVGETVEELAAPARLAYLLAPFGVTDVEVQRSAGYTYRAQVAGRWRDRRVLLAGDAAHLTPPFIGQGLALGLRDVHQLAWKLAAVLDGRAGDALLDTHQAEREPHARALVRVALLLGRLMTGGGRGAAAVRTAVLAGARRVPAVAALAVSTRTPALRRGPLVDRRGRGGRRLAGTLVPQPDVRVAGRPCRLDDVLGPGCAELARRDGGLAVRRVPGAAWTPVEDGSGELDRWLGGARGVVVRPDRIVRSVLGPGA
jgi:3-(3-hydroxy-phenyl)propionate hydroxylase